MTELAAIREIRRLGLDAFCEQYAIGRVEANGLISLKYNQAESPMSSGATGRALSPARGASGS